MIHTILLVDECPMVRRGMAQLLEATEGFRVVGEAGGIEEALRAAGQLRPDVILIEPNFSDSGSRRSKIPEVGFCQSLVDLPFSPKVIVYTAYDGQMDIVSTAICGASGYIHKSIEERDFISALQGLLDGDSDWLFGLGEDYTRSVTRSALKISALSRREKDILPLVLQRYSSREIAAELHISNRTSVIARFRTTFRASSENSTAGHERTSTKRGGHDPCNALYSQSILRKHGCFSPMYRYSAAGRLPFRQVLEGVCIEQGQSKIRES